MSEPTIQQLFDLTNRAALVTGASGHLGGAISRALAEAGASVVVTSRDRLRAEALATSLPCPGSARHHALELDHFDTESIERAAADAVERTGGIDILVNNGHAVISSDWTNIDADTFNRQLANATGYFMLSRQIHADAVRRQQPASVIMLGSMYSLVGSYPDAYQDIVPASSVAYHALKGSIAQITRHLAVYWAADRVRVNCLCPGPFPRPTAPAEMVRRLTTKSPSKRMGEPWELKGAIVFLASEASSYMTGQTLVVDGGWTAW